MDKVNIKVNNLLSGFTIKEVLKCFNVGRSKIEEIRVNKISFLNQKNVSIDSVVNKGDILSFSLNEKINFLPSPLKIEVLYEDDYLLIVNKDKGLLIHPDGNNKEDTLVNRVASYYYENKIFREVRPIHRIDLDTTGIVIFAKDFITHAKLDEMISKHQIKRTYLALCQNRFKDLEGVIDKKIGRDRHIKGKYRVSNSSESKSALTYYKVVKQLKGYALVELNLKTGRTHQIRVHMSYLNHPLLGDMVYGGSTQKIGRVALHSYQVDFLHPISGEYVCVKCPLPLDMEKLVK